ncbi:hypothetical protein CC1G_14162 [Coprinopsis cinerea okayama7|uniref:FAD dependent oxidoreductase domain-containing protein n=1 Tax=Coprinopsis cinerea (strain Okayama-7 / 130 / ATCC MYA-4618 / FGSC 9003) TaxID=240176 RepID=D6RL63_COPC7|nr:hypothetical protein CC1G_14162 [Coprinopsis cinerea okayama7\|eukprot:XP_002911629.1 hypothetical protein CC1G_14162 [Coprinopsis cinerea okayama7\
MHRVQTSDKIVILGCGCFGASAAFHLMQRGYANVTVLDKSATLPAPDAASNDINRIVRSSYNDKFYAELARHAILSWKNVEEWDDTYHESGVVVLGFPLTDSKDGGTDTSATPEREIPYAEAAYLNDLDLGARVSLLRSNSKEDFQSVFPAGVSVTSRGLPASFRNRAGYFNRDGGWVNAGKGLAMIIEKVKKLGGNVVPGKEARNIIVDPGKCKKVVCADGTEYEADIVIIATGSWTPSTFPELFKDSCLATGQCVAMIELTPEEAARCKDCPVVLDFETGFYVFPDRIMKMAIHAAGYTNTVAGISTPRTLTSDPTDGLSIPMEAMAKLREGLVGVYPEFQERPFCATRLCW